MTLGGGNKSGLFQVLNTDYSPRVAAECMNRLAKLRWVAADGVCLCIGRGALLRVRGRVAAPQRWAPATTLCQDPLFQLTSSIQLLPPPPCPTLQRSLHRGRRLLNRH